MAKGPDEIKNQGPKDRAQQSFWNFSDKNAAELQREIRVTRADLDETVIALQAKFSPQQLTNEAYDYLRDMLRAETPKIRQVVRDGASNVVDAIRSNPMPSTLIALGVGWLFMRSGQRGSVIPIRHYEEYPSESEYELSPEGRYSATERMDLSAGGIEPTARKAADWASRKAEKAKEKTGQLASQAKEKTSQLADQAKEKMGQLAGQAKETASDLAGQAKEKVGHLTEATRETAGRMAHQVRVQTQHLGEFTKDQVSRAGTEVSHVYQGNPLAFGALCIGLGAAIGLSLRETRMENEVMGETRDTLMAQAKETGREVMEKVERVAERTRETAKDEARQQNLM